MINDLSKFLKVDIEKQKLINNILYPHKLYQRKFELRSIEAPDLDISDEDYDELICNEYSVQELLPKFCPECHKKYPDGENICFDCLVSLKYVTDKIPVQDIKTNPIFTFKGKNNLDTLESILNEDNVQKINDFRFNLKDFNRIIRNIKKTSLTNLDELIKKNYVDMNEISPRDKVLLFTKSFVPVNFKSYGQELGYFENDIIVIDDRQSDSFQITTLIHELSHFILKEIISEILCKLLDCNKNNKIDVISSFILSYSNFTCLIDEYSAHCCEGRFTVYGYQDYSSFLNIVKLMDGEMTKEEIEITKSIGNNFANSIKNILETFIDNNLLKEIKDDFMLNRQDNPNYEMLKLENCEMLTDEGFMKAIWLIVSEGFKTACENIDDLSNRC